MGPYRPLRNKKMQPRPCALPSKPGRCDVRNLSLFDDPHMASGTFNGPSNRLYKALGAQRGPKLPLPSIDQQKNDPKVAHDRSLLGSRYTRSRLQDKESLMDRQGAQDEPERRPGGPGRDKRARGTPLNCFEVPCSSRPSFWLFPGLPGDPSSYRYLEIC